MSDLRKAAQEYLKGRRALGFTLYASDLLLRQFVKFMEEQGATVITQELAVQWATLPRNCHQAHWARRLSVIRQFAAHYSATDDRTEIPPQGLLPYKYLRTQPYIYTEKQILALIDAAKKLPSKTGLRALTYSTLFGLLAVTGMRITETMWLDREDVDLREGVLNVRHTKLDKPRLIPIHPSAVKALRHYACQRDRVHPEAKTPSFLVAESGTRLTTWTVRWTFNRLSRQIGLRGPSDHFGPRIHDIRHTFAVRMLQDWYQQNKNVEKRLRHLATFLGHTHVNDTYWYLTATPDLLKAAAKRVASSKREYVR